MWVRLHYVYPYPHVDEVFPLMAEGKILLYLDIPFQHANPRILKLMKRPAAAEKTLERIHAWRKVCPDLTIRSTFIAGFPGETEAEFQELPTSLTEAQLDRVGCFAYSPVEGARANDLPGAHLKKCATSARRGSWPTRKKSARRACRPKWGARSMCWSTGLRKTINANASRWVLESRCAGDRWACVCDGCVEETAAGEFVRARVVAAQAHDLVAAQIT